MCACVPRRYIFCLSTLTIIIGSGHLSSLVVGFWAASDWSVQDNKIVSVEGLFSDWFFLSESNRNAQYSGFSSTFFIPVFFILFFCIFTVIFHTDCNNNFNIKISIVA